jgi:hypothetical protein
VVNTGSGLAVGVGPGSGEAAAGDGAADDEVLAVLLSADSDAAGGAPQPDALTHKIAAASNVIRLRFPIRAVWQADSRLPTQQQGEPAKTAVLKRAPYRYERAVFLGNPA